MTDTHYKQLLALQLKMNYQTWETLQGHGVTEQSLLRLDFSYDAPNRETAEALVASLKEETDYDVRAESSISFFRRKWRVKGTTQKTAVSLDILDKWVVWMVTTGEKQTCDFDGWGTQL